MDNINFFNLLKWRVKTQTLYKMKCRCIGRKTTIFHPMRLENMKNCKIGSRVFIGSYSWLIGGGNQGCLIISDGVNIGNFAHIVAKNSIIIEKKALIADKVFITDNTHEFDDISLPIKEQSVSVIGNVIIGEGCWIGESVAVLGASVGKHCVIGANSVVIHNIPDYSIAVGAPAKVIKRFNFETQAWEAVTK